MVWVESGGAALSRLESLQESYRGATWWTSSCLRRPAQPPPPLAGPRHREDAPQEPGSRPSGLSGASDAPPTRCQGHWWPRGHVAATQRLRAPSSATSPPREWWGPLQEGTAPAHPRRRTPGHPFHRPCGGSGRTGIPATLARLPRFPQPQGRQPELVSACTPSPGLPTLQGEEAAAPEPRPSGPCPCRQRSGFAELSGGAKKSRWLRAIGAPGCRARERGSSGGPLCNSH